MSCSALSLMATPKQVSYIRALIIQARQAGIDTTPFRVEDFDLLTKRKASAMIDDIKKQLPGSKPLWHRLPSSQRMGWL